VTEETFAMVIAAKRSKEEGSPNAEELATEALLVLDIV
jgi:hypothetical protein